MPYLNVEEIESWTEVIELAHPGLCTRIQLPNLTPEERKCYAINLRAGPRADRHGVLFIGNQHAREWGSSDILVNFTERLIAAYEGGTGVTFQGKAYTATQVREALDAVDLFVVPCVNPDGRAYSQTVDSMWRKNRRPIPGTIATGTDLNRNYDFLWNYRATFDPVMFDGLYPAELVVNDDPVNDPRQLFHGTASLSEPETQNVVSLFEAYPHIRFLVDIHSFRQIVGYPWGDDSLQVFAPDRNFLNATYDGVRGPGGAAGSAYGEYLRQVDYTRLNALANRMSAALQSVRGIYYSTGPTYNTLYPTCGTSTCYAFSRHLADTSKTKVDSFLLEWGLTFQPPYDTEMVLIFDDVGAALTDLCVTADHVPLVEVMPRKLQFRRWNSQSVKITNKGVRSVVLQSATIEPGADAGAFVVIALTPSVLTVGATATVTVSYSSGNGSAKGKLLIEVIEVGQPLADVVPVELERSVPRPRRKPKRWRLKRIKVPKVIKEINPKARRGKRPKRTPR
jgi:murein tripeptide amidase MpaA